jgi:hypothetical protein
MFSAILKYESFCFLFDRTSRQELSVVPRSRCSDTEIISPITSLDHWILKGFLESVFSSGVGGNHSEVGMVRGILAGITFRSSRKSPAQGNLENENMHFGLTENIVKVVPLARKLVPVIRPRTLPTKAGKVDTKVTLINS